MTGVLERELVAVAPDDVADSRRKGTRNSVVLAVGSEISGQVIGTCGDGVEADEVGLGELAPSAVDPQDAAFGIENAEVMGESIDCSAGSPGVERRGFGDPRLRRVGNIS
jgi:hypothetical protein